MIVGVPMETYPGERRVAMVPSVIPLLLKAGCEVLVQRGAGIAAGYEDDAYVTRGAKLAESRAEVFATADIIIQVLCHGANDKSGEADLPLIRRGQVLVGFLRPLGSPRTVAEIAATGATAFAVELMPRITRSQSMDAQSAMATVCGYKAVITAADLLPRFFPMLTTAAGTITPARVLVLGAGVAGLQAIATSRRLGAVVSAYDVRPAVKEQIVSVGGRFIELPLETTQAEDSRGYAQAQGESFYRRQREVLAKVIAESDVVITTAVVPGQKAPTLVTGEMVATMARGSVIIDLAAERGGNTELTEAGKIATTPNGVRIFAPLNLAGEVPVNASSLYAKNLYTFLETMIDKKDKTLKVNWDDEIVKGTLVAKDGKIVHPNLTQSPA